MKSRSKFLCLDCKVDTGKIYEHYYLKDEVWLSVVTTKIGMLCVHCIENRLGRLLHRNDFTICSINTAKHEPKSARLMNRLGRVECLS